MEREERSRAAYQYSHLSFFFCKKKKKHLLDFLHIKVSMTRLAERFRDIIGFLMFSNKKKKEGRRQMLYLITPSM